MARFFPGSDISNHNPASRAMYDVPASTLLQRVPIIMDASRVVEILRWRKILRCSKRGLLASRNGISRLVAVFELGSSHVEFTPEDMIPTPRSFDGVIGSFAGLMRYYSCPVFSRLRLTVCHVR